MKRQDIKHVTTGFIMLFTALIMAFVAKKYESESMYKIEFSQNNQDVTIWCDINGLVTDASVNKGQWTYRGVYNIDDLKEGSLMQYYDLANDTFFQDSVRITAITKK
ncbi:hypothetical protein ACR79P_08365 [Sphingobacterium spiritivorum]|uniref:hypothetical protein n=1 Tax=Sphingobacterium spiritivorum TaxID=258 RepID=UPI003DA26B7E